MYKNFLIMLCIFIAAAPAQALRVKKFKPLTPQKMQTVQPLQDTYAQNFQTNENYPKITELELNIFKKSYEKENIYSRLTRLENKVFKRNFSGMPLASRVDNLLENIDAGIIYGISSKDLAKLESKVLGRTYFNDDTESRITRLEKEMLGAMQGGNLKERYKTIKTASKHYNSYPEIVQNQVIYPQSSTYGYNPYMGYTPSMSRQYNSYGTRGILRNMASRLFGGFGPGSLTGFTPPIYDTYSPYSPYSSYMGRYGMGQGMGHRKYYMGNRGGYLRDRSFGNGASIRILD